MTTLTRIAGATLSLVVTFLIIFVFKIGPVILTLTKDHGVHIGDMLGVCSFAVAAWLLWPLFKR